MTTQSKNITEYLNYLIDDCFRQAIREASDEATKTIAARIEEKFKAKAELFQNSFEMGTTIRLRLEHNFEDQLADLNKRVAELQEQNAEQASLLAGECPECKRQIRGWKAPHGYFAPEAWATLREHGVNPATGHLAICSRQSLEIA
jgi:hypothetical protein